MNRVHALLAATIVVTALTAAPAAGEAPCVPRVLVLGAMPLEVHPLLDAGTFDAADTIRADGHTFYVGTISDVDVALAMTGIGLVNAERATHAAFEHLPCGVSGIVFSGVAGSYARIGDVLIAERWTTDGGATWYAADARMLARARELEGTDVVPLARAVPVGDEACACPGVDTIGTAVQVDHEPSVTVGGDGTSGDTYGDHAMPCVPGGGDTFGCEPCLAPGATAEDALAFAQAAPSYLDPAFFEAFFQPPAGTTDRYASQDMESAVVARIALEQDVPFLAIRGVSDGTGDPLSLPGFPAQFFVYRHLAADNAAATTVAFLERWRPDAATTSAPASATPAPTAPDGLPATGGGAAVAALLVGASAALRRRTVDAP